MGRPRQRLIERREDLGLTRERVAEALRISPKTYARLERGDTLLRVGQRPQLAKLLGWSTAELRVALSENGATAPNGQVVPEWLTLYASLEQGAAQLWTYQPVTVHALLQTPDYAAAVERVAPVPITPEGVARRVELRMTRQGVLDREPEPLHLSVVLDESVLHRMTGGPDVMVAQLDHLVREAQRPNVELLILPLTAGVHSASFGAFTLLTSAGASAPQVACVSDRTGVRYLEGSHVVDAHTEVFDHLREFALPPPESREAITSAAKEIQG